MKQRNKILYADDDLDDIAWVKEACKAINCSLDMNFVENGREVLEYLEQCNGADFPVLIVLDLNMPKLDGRQTLQKIKSNANYNNIPVIIVTTSSNKADIEICKRLGASLYLIKPDNHIEWQQIVKHFLPYVA